MPDYTTDKGIARALAAGAGDAPGQVHVDDWIRTHPDQNDYGMASLLRTVSGSAQTLAGGGTSNYFLDTSNNEGNITDLGMQTLAQAKQYDPNAHFESGVLIFDRSKLPKFAGAGIDESKNPLTALSVNNAGDRVKDPRYIIKDPNYGDYTFTGNLKQASNDEAGGGIMGQAQTYMPTVVGSIMAMASGGMISPQLMQMLASLSEGGGDMGNLLAMIGSAIANQYAPGAGTAINLAAGAARRGG